MRRIVRLVVSAAMIGALGAASRTAWAGASAHLVYMRGPGAEQCPGEDALRAAVGTRLGYDPFFAWAKDTLFVEITRAGSSYRARIALVDDHNLQRGAREISVDGNDCSAVIDAVGLTASLTIDPSSVTGPPAIERVSAEPDPSATAEAPATPAVPSMGAAQPEKPPDRAPPTARRARADVGGGARTALAPYLGIGVVGSLGGAPDAAVGAMLLAGLEWRSWFVDLEGRVDVPATGASDAPGLRVTSWLLAGTLAPCVRVRFVFGCAVLSAGARGATSNAVSAHTSYAGWAAGGARAGVDLAISRALSWRAYAELLAAFTPHELVVDGAPVYGFGTLSGGLGLAIAWHFP